MNRLDFLNATSNYNESMVEETENNITRTDSAERFKIKSKSPWVVMVVSGSLIIGASAPLSAHEIGLSVSCTDDFQKDLKDYYDIFDQPFDNYFNEISKINKGLSDHESEVSPYKKKELIKEILSFKILENSWDGYGALPLEVESATNSIMLIDLIGESEFFKVSEFYPNPHGTISFEWNSDQMDVVLEVGNSSMSYYVEMASGETFHHNNKEINIEEAKKIAKYIQNI